MSKIEMNTRRHFENLVQCNDFRRFALKLCKQTGNTGVYKL